MGELGFCNYRDITPVLAAMLTGDIAADKGMPFFLIRILHNKAAYGILLSLKCYMQYLDFAQIFSFVSPFLASFMAFAYFGKHLRRRMILITLLYPLVFIFLLREIEIGWKIYLFQGFWILIAVIGFFKAVNYIFRKNNRFRLH